MKTFVRFLICLLFLFTVCISNAQTTFTLNSLFNFGSTATPYRGDGSIQPGDTLGGTSPYTGYPVLISSGGSPNFPFASNVWYVCPTNAALNETNVDQRGTGSTNGFNMRGLTFDNVSGNLIFIDPHNGSGGGETNSRYAGLYILDGNTGTIIAGLNTNGIVDQGGTGVGGYPMVCVGAADDGVIYVCSQTLNSATRAFKLYRWTTADTNNPGFGQPPVVAFSNLLATTLGTSGERIGQTMDVRGSGTNTQIILGTSSLGGTGTNIFLFTTTDGTNFSPIRISFTNVITSAQFNDGIAFGPGNTFFAKQVNKPFLYMAYASTNGWDPATNNQIAVNQIGGTVISSFAASSPNDPLLNISAIAYDPIRKLVGGLEEIGGTATGGRGNVWLFHLPDPTNHAPAVLGSRTYIPNYQKTTAPMGYIRFRYGTNLYAHASNNGFLCSSVDSAFLNPPSFNTDLPTSTRIAVGQNVHFEVFAVIDVTNYQWYSNNVAIPGANSYYYDIPSATAGMSGSVFKVVAFNAAGSATSANSTLSVVSTSQFFHTVPLWSVSANGLSVNGATYVPTNFITSSGGSGTPNERCVAYNAVSNQLLVARGRAPASSGFLDTRIFVVNADAGTNGAIYTLKTNGLTAAQNVCLAGLAVSDDGAVYAATVSTSDNSFKIYRWANTDPNTIPITIWGTNSTSTNLYPNYPYNPVADLTGSQIFRFGDTLSARGSGMSTEIILDSQNSSKFVSILTPLDSGMTNWNESGYLLQNIQGSYGSEAYGTTIGRSIQFGNGNTFYQKRYNGTAGSPLALMTYSGGGGISPLSVANVSPDLFTNASVAVNPVLGLAAGLNILAGTGNGATGSRLELFDLTDPSQAVILGAQNMPMGTAAATNNTPGTSHIQNGNAVGQVIFAVNQTTGTNYIFAIEGNNGIAAFVLSGGTVPPPKIIAQPKNLRTLQGSSGSLGVALDQPATVLWYKGTNSPVFTGSTGNNYTINNATQGDSGDYFVIATNANGAVTSTVAHVTIALANDNYTLTKVWGTAPGALPYVTSNGGANTPNERAFAYNALSNQLIVVHCPAPTANNIVLYVVDALSGASLYTLNTNGLLHEGASEVSGSNPIDLVGAAASDDGSIYICNQSPNASGGAAGDPTKMFHLFRWSNSAPSTLPMMVFQGDPSGQPAGINLRWGDVLTARGSGTNTELFLNSQDGTYGAVLKPTDANLTNFVSYFFTDVGGAGSIGRSVQFGPGSTVYEKRKGSSLTYSSYDTNAQAATFIQEVDSSTTLGGVALDTAHTLAIGVDFVGSASATPDAVAVYDITDVNSPMLIKRYNFPVNQNANANVICETIVSGNRVWSLDANNGMLFLNIIPPVNSMKLNIVNSGTNSVVLSWGNSQAILQSTTDLSSPTWTDIAGPGVTNSVQPASSVKLYRLIQRL
jgi:hypothetical protein